MDGGFEVVWDIFPRKKPSPITPAFGLTREVLDLSLKSVILRRSCFLVRWSLKARPKISSSGAFRSSASVSYQRRFQNSEEGDCHLADLGELGLGLVVGRGVDVAQFDKSKDIDF